MINRSPSRPSLLLLLLSDLAIVIIIIVDVDDGTAPSEANSCLFSCLEMLSD